MTRKGKQEAAKPEVRVAIYTRQSILSTQEFGSIAAQREAIEALIVSRKGDNWRAIETHYDDAGCSGKSTDRPAFQRLLADIEAGKVDVVACYKLDRVSRSVADLTKFIAYLEEKDVGFVASSQSIDTRGSTGRLLLHILASVAQFEREVIAERTRDKALASRKRGMWTGGCVPLGYDLIDKKLVVNGAEAAVVNEIFATFLTFRSLQPTCDELDRRGIKTKAWTAKSKRTRGGKPFGKDSLADLLRNPIYTGRVRFDGGLANGLHEAIVPHKTWDAVQHRLDDNSRGDPTVRNRWNALLRGLAKCSACGGELSHTTVRHDSKVHRYYRCRERECKRTSAPAVDLERFVVSKLRAIGKDPAVVEKAIATAKAEAKALRPPLRARVTRIEAEHRALREQKEGLLLAAGQAAKAGDDGAAALKRVDEIDIALRPIEARLAAARNELAALDATAVDAEALREQLAAFDEVFEHLTTPEKARLITLLVERVVVDVEAQIVEIHFRGAEPGKRRATA